MVYDFYLRLLWTAVCYGSALVIMFLAYRAEPSKRHRRWKLVLVVFLTIGGVGTMIQNYVLPFYGVLMPINESANTLVATFLFGWAMSDFKLIEYYADPSFEELADPMPVLLILTSKRWNVQNLNPAAAQFFEQPELDEQPSKVWELFPADVRDKIKEYFIKQRRPVNLVLKDHLENKKHFSFTSSPVCNRRGDTIGHLVQGTDMSSYYAALEESRAYAEQLKKSNLALERFAYIASHDIKEPARTIANFVGLLRRSLDGNCTKEVKEQLDFLEHNSKRLHKIIESILEFSLLKTQTEEAVLEEVDMNQLLAEVLKEKEHALCLRNAKVEAEPLPKINAKGSLLKLVFINLINNGIKFNKQAEPCIYISAYSEKGKWIFVVKDNGIGIDPEFQERVFEMYQRLHAWSDVEGTGIGLAICERIVADAGGRIWVESDGKSGSTFYFSIPVVEPEV